MEDLTQYNEQMTQKDIAAYLKERQVLLKYKENYEKVVGYITKNDKIM